MSPAIYLDYNATTPIDPAVAEAVEPWIKQHFGNPSSSHAYGRIARQAVEQAREQVASLLGVDADEILFTSGATESNHWVLYSTAQQFAHRGRHMIISAIEHPSITQLASQLEQQGWQISRIKVDQYGRIDMDHLLHSIRKDTVLISIMHSNNEVGSLQPIEEIAEIAYAHDIIIHSDAAQSLGKVALNARHLGVDLLSIAGHKCYAPKGIGALYIRRGNEIRPLFYGGGQEFGLRAGTENVAWIVALGKACELIEQGREEQYQHLSRLGQRLYQGLKQAIPEIQLNGHPEQRLPNTLNLSFPLPNRVLLERIQDQVAVSAGAACHSGSSSVLQAMQLDEQRINSALRLSLGRMSTELEIEQVITLFKQAISE